MDNAEFICLLYIYCLYNRDKYSKTLLVDFKESVIKCYLCSTSISDFITNFLCDSLSLPSKEYKIRSKFIKWIEQQNRLLGYKLDF